jgi:hypothetical protein
MLFFPRFLSQSKISKTVENLAILFFTAPNFTPADENGKIFDTLQI